MVGQKTVKERGVRIHAKCKAEPAQSRPVTACAYAGFWDRLGARILDAIVIGLPLGLLSTLSQMLFKTDYLRLQLIGWIDIDFVITTLYWAAVCWMIATTTQSIGLKARKIQLVHQEGRSAGFVRTWLRDWFNVATFGLGNLLILFHPERRSAADILFKTKIIFGEPSR